MAREFLSTYLNDHLAGAQAALEIVSRIRELGDSDLWRQIEIEINQDRQELEGLIQTIGATRSTVRRAAAWTAEKLAEVKMRVDDPSGGGLLRRLELIEALAIGIDGKRALWTALQRALASASECETVDYARLIARAEQQRRLVEAERLDAALRALRSTSP